MLVNCDIIPCNVFLKESPDNVGSPYWNLLSVKVTRADATNSIVTGTYATTYALAHTFVDYTPHTHRSGPAQAVILFSVHFWCCVISCTVTPSLIPSSTHPPLYISSLLFALSYYSSSSLSLLHFILFFPTSLHFSLRFSFLHSLFLFFLRRCIWQCSAYCSSGRLQPTTIIQGATLLTLDV